jgi:hypothetical protein
MVDARPRTLALAAGAEAFAAPLRERQIGLFVFFRPSHAGDDVWQVKRLRTGS